MIARQAFTLNVALGAVAVGLGAYIVWEVFGPAPSGGPQTRPKPTTSAPIATPAGRPTPEPASSWAVIASRNPFSPSRSELPATGAQAGAALNVPKPNLFGIVLKDGAPFAYIEDPATKRVAAYRIGDAVAGGTVQKIARDGIVLARPDGVLDVRLHDPGKPRPAAPAASSVPGSATPPLPGVIPPASGSAPPQAQAPAETPPQPQQTPPATPSVESATPPRAPTRRPLPPNLLRRLPQPPPSADDQNR